MPGPMDYSKSDYLRLLKSAAAPSVPPGDPNWAPQPARKIAIIGAGMAGLTAGWLLKKAGHEIRIFEASNSVGGRIKTLRDGFSSDGYAEAGAMRIPESHALTRELVRLSGLGEVEFFNIVDNSIIFINNRHVTYKDYEQDIGRLGFVLTDEEKKRKTADQLFDDAVKEHINGLQEGQTSLWPDFDFQQFDDDCSREKRERRKNLLIELDKHSLRSFLRHEAKIKGNQTKGNCLSEGAVAMICAVMASEMELSVSLAELVNDHAELHGVGKHYRIPGGMDRLPKAFVTGKFKSHDLAKNVFYSNRVVEIRGLPSATPLRIWTENPVTRQRFDYDCNFVIVAIPFSALRHVYMPALLEPYKELAIRQLHYQNACKIFIEFSERFWDHNYAGDVPGTKPIPKGSSITDRPVRQIFYPEEGKVLLASYTWGDDALRWTSLKHDDRIRFALRDLAIVHNREEQHGRRVLEEIFVGGLSHSWAENEFTAGGFASFEPYQFTDLFDSIWKSEGNIHFCGEHTSTKHGWIEGAVESGIRAAREVYEVIEKGCRPSLPAQAMANRSTALPGPLPADPSPPAVGQAGDDGSDGSAG